MIFLLRQKFTLAARPSAVCWNFFRFVGEYREEENFSREIGEIRQVSSDLFFLRTVI